MSQWHRPHYILWSTRFVKPLLNPFFFFFALSRWLSLRDARCNNKCNGDPNKSNFKHRQLNVNFFIGMWIKCMVICNALGRGITKIKGLGQGNPQVWACNLGTPLPPTLCIQCKLGGEPYNKPKHTYMWW